MSLACLRRLLAVPSARCFSPFFVVGDPDAERWLATVRGAIRAGASMLELGLAFSDPVADGPSVQAACGRALASGVRTDRAFELMVELRRETEVPFNLLVYANLVHAVGIEAFVRRAVEAGASSLLVPDAGLEEGGALAEVCAAHGLGIVNLCGPRTEAARIARIAAASTAFVYLVGHQGTTGARSGLDPAAIDNVRRVVQLCGSANPVAVGFGLSRPEHLAAIFDAGARIGIVGSGLIDTIAERAADGPAALGGAIERRVRGLVEGIHNKQN